jgi:hypothetical protein
MATAELRRFAPRSFLTPGAWAGAGISPVPERKEAAMEGRRLWKAGGAWCDPFKLHKELENGCSTGLAYSLCSTPKQKPRKVLFDSLQQQRL